ncbi:MAG: Gfo/Idh/MocA family protein [Planctomycetota bacterium]
MSKQTERVSRRRFLRSGAIAAGGLTILGAASARGQAKKTLTAGLIGCGGRGTGAAHNCVQAGKQLGVDVKIVALADVFPDRVQRTRRSVKKTGSEVPDGQCFVGFDAYKKLVGTDVDIVLMATTPSFRPSQFEAAVKADKHVFMEKPVAVDPVGCRQMYELGELATQKKLSVMPGTCLRHHRGYAGSRQQIADGLIGRVLGGTIYYCTGRLGFTRRREGWTDREYMIRNWKSFCETSGDHIVEQHVHTIDMLLWILGATPVAAVANGGRARRQTGNMYDNFSIDFEFPDHVHIHSISRQINGCWNWGNGLAFAAEKGWLHGTGGVRLWDDTKPPMPTLDWHRSMYVQEHVVLLDSILHDKAYNGTRGVTDGTLAAVMGRMAAYTGKRITWQQLTDPKAKGSLATFQCEPTPADFEADQVKAPPDDVVPLPGKP